MKDLPNPFWAFMFILLAVVLALAVLLHPSNNNTVDMAILALCSSLIAGALGYINGHKDGVTSVSVPTQPSSTAATTVTTGPAATPTVAKETL
jgi:hypothetical protein